MPKFSLINVMKEHDDGSIDGYWIQDYIGNLEGAIGKAWSINKVNGNKLHISIVPAINSTVPQLNYCTNL